MFIFSFTHFFLYSVATAISADSGFKDSSAAGSRRSSQSVNRIESTVPHDSKSVHSFVSDLGIVRDASLNSLNSSVIQLKQNEGECVIALITKVCSENVNSTVIHLDNIAC